MPRTPADHRTAARAAAVAAITLLPVGLALPASAAATGEATVSVLHAVPGLTVDVYANGEELIPDFEPGTLTDPLTLPAGSYDLQVFADGEGPGGEPAIEANDVAVPADVNATVVAHLDAAGTPVLTVFVNDTSQLAAGEARVTARHTAAAPAVDVRADGAVVFAGVENPDEGTAEVAAGTISADVVLAGTTEPVLGPADVELAEGTSTILYAWGSAEDGTLALASQSITGLHGEPGGVPGGEAGLVPADGGLGSGLLLGVAALALVGGGLVVARRAMTNGARG